MGVQVMRGRDATYDPLSLCVVFFFLEREVEKGVDRERGGDRDRGRYTCIYIYIYIIYIYIYIII